MGAIKVHHTATSDKPWDKGPNVKRLREGEDASYYRQEYAWEDSDEDGTKKSYYKYPHHEVSESGDVGAASISGCHAVIANLNGARGGSSIPDADRRGVYNHAKAHLEDAGEKDIADLKSLEEKPKRMARSYPHLASRIFGSPLAIRREKLDAILAAIGPRLDIDVEDLKPQAYGAGDPKEKKEYLVEEGGIAVIPVQGTLVKRGGWLAAYSGMTGYDSISDQFRDAIADTNIRGILLDVDSPGGECSGLFDLADEIFAARGTKPIWAIADDDAFSAAYAIASAADRIYVTRTGGVGSIGVIALHCDQSGFDKDLGVKYTAIYAGEHKNDGSPHAPLSSEAKSRMQSEVDRIYQMFTSTVARNRKIAEQKVINTQAGLYFADQGVQLLADKVGTYEDVLRDLTAHLEGKAPAGITRAEGETFNVAVKVDTADLDAAVAKVQESMNQAMTTLSLLGQHSAPCIEPVSAAANEAIAAEGPVAGSVAEESKKETAEMAKENVNAVATEIDEIEEQAAVQAASDCDMADGDGSDNEDESDEEMTPEAKKKAKAKKAKKSAPANEDEDVDEADEPKEKSGKKAVVASPAKRIAMLCTLAGAPERAAEFIGNDATVAEVEEALLEMRSKKQTPAVSTHAPMNGNANSFANLAKKAQSEAKKNGVTKEQAVTEALLSNPEAYEYFLEVEKAQFEAQCRANRDRSRSYQVVQG